MSNIANIKQLFKSAFADFRRDKVRTGLTSLGITIGVLSVVLLIALGLGLKNYIQDQFESMGANLVMIMPGSGFSSGNMGPGMMTGTVKFDEKDVKNLKKIEELKYVVPIFMSSTTISSANKEKIGTVMAVNEEAFPLLNIKMQVGETWGKTELNKKSKVAVIGYTMTEDLFENINDAIGKSITVEGMRIKVIGVSQKTGDPDQDAAIYIPYTTSFGSINPDKTFWGIYLGVIDKDDVTAVTEKAKEILLERYDKDKFSVTEQSEILSTIDQIFGIINIVLVAIGSISLLVGGIGIMNIMYATVTERTREVGIRRALGATKRDILLQFLSESTLLSVFGGLMGLVLATVIVMLVRIWFPVALNLVAVLVAIGVSSAIGIFFGVSPAKKAANLSPIDAIRYE
ncbi:MAG TPA: ABC transporter permease [Candidatus Woesebacteria bacterium]|mgnify:CR=1 FL=1|nr:ABC transporter permease [Candidatus Woesebacteria bacterium]